MKKRILSLLLAFLMAFSMIPGQTFAADGAEEPTETPTEAPDAHAAVLAEVDNTCCTMYNGIHDATCENYTCPNCGTGPWHEVCPEIEEPPTETPTEPHDRQAGGGYVLCGQLLRGTRRKYAFCQQHLFC